MTVSEDAAVPPAALLVRDFVNTYEPQVDEEALTSSDALGTWLTDRGLLPADTKLRATDLAAAVAIREGLRAVLLGHAGHLADPAVVQRLDETLAAIPVRLSLAPDGPRLTAAGDTTFEAAMAGLIDAIRECAQTQAWARLKVCDRDTCRWAYYDASRNQARRWCSMAGCGNYIKMRRAYAARTR